MSGGEGPRLLTVGSVNSGATLIQVDTTTLGSDIAISVRLTTDYAMLNPPGYPFRPAFTGSATPQYPHVVASGSVISVLKCESVALINAGAASLA